MKEIAARIRATAAAVLVAVAAVAPAGAQEQQQLVEEVAARVNADVITRSQYLEAVEEAEADFKRNLPASEATQKFAEFKPKVLDLMIDNLLMIQKGQDLGIDVEAQVNAQFTRIAQEQNLTITALEDAMRQQGVDPNEARARLRDRLIRDAVMNQEVYGSIWRALSDREKREFYDAHKDKFMQPGELKLSEIFIPVEGRSFGEIETKAREIVTSARGGAAFKDLVKKYGDPTRASYANGGSLGSFKSADELSETLAKAVAPLKTNEVSDPLRVADGIIIIHVDERREAAPRKYEEVSNDVALALVYDRSKDAEEKFLKKLRAEAYIKVNKGYDSTIGAPTAKSEN